MAGFHTVWADSRHPIVIDRFHGNDNRSHYKRAATAILSIYLSS